MSLCLHCGNVNAKYATSYCSNKCQSDLIYASYIQQWKLGRVTGGRGIAAKNISAHVKRYLQEKYLNRCSMCGWCEQNPITKTVPLEIDHIDGNSDNNSENNLRLLCPNCHSLTPNFRNLNSGNGRSWRRLKYIKVQ